MTTPTKLADAESLLSSPRPKSAPPADVQLELGNVGGAGGPKGDAGLDAYRAFIARKLATAPTVGIPNHGPISPLLFPHQRTMVDVALRKGRFALFHDTGLGKGWQILEWARLVAEHTGNPVLVLAPLAVARQFDARGREAWHGGAYRCVRRRRAAGDQRHELSQVAQIRRLSLLGRGPGRVIDPQVLRRVHAYGPDRSIRRHAVPSLRHGDAFAQRSHRAGQPRHVSRRHVLRRDAVHVFRARRQ